MKKISLIAALVLALTVIFIGCGADYVEPPAPPETETFTDVELGTDYNYVAGDPDNQKGWATDGHNEATKKLGLKLEDFQAAKFLVLELKDGGIQGGISIIWGGYGENKAEDALGLSNAGWMSQQIVSNGGEPDAGKGAKLTGKTLKIELSKALARYDAYTSSVLTEVKICIAYYQGIANLIDKAYLQISSVPPEFFPAASIDIKPVTGKIAKTDIKLEATITPKEGNDTTSVQLVTWEITGGTLKFPVDVNFAYPSPAGVNSARLGDTIYVSNAGGGKVKVRASLKGGGEDKDGKKIDIVSDVYEIVVGANPFPGTAIIKSDEVDVNNGNVNDFWTKTDATTYPKYLVAAAYVGAGTFNKTDYLDLSFNTGASTPNQESGKANPFSISVSGTGIIYYVIDLSGFTNYTRFMSDYGWGVQLRNWGGNFGGTFKVFLIKSSVTSLTKPSGAIDFDYDQVGGGSGKTVMPGYVANDLPVELSWE